MKTIIVSVLLIFACVGAVAQEVPCNITGVGYEACVIHDDIYWRSENEWAAWHSAQFYLDGILQTNYNSYDYRWYEQVDGVGNWILIHSGSGMEGRKMWIDNDINDLTYVYVRIIVDGDTITSSTVTTAKYGYPKFASLYARKEDGTPLAGFSADTIGRWSGYKWGSLTSGDWASPGSSIPMSHGEELKIKPNIAGLGEKFHRGVTANVLDQIRYANYAAYPIYPHPQENSFTFHHRGFCEATIKAELWDVPSAAGTIQFKDPWLEDVVGYGGENRSQGMSAPFKTNSSPWTISTTSEYRGVFLNQVPDPQDPLKPYYSVGAPNPNTFTINGNNYSAYFRNWEGSSVQYQNADAAQTGVVFTSSGAMATANYKLHLASSSPEAVAFNNQRKITRDNLGYWHKVYQSAGLIWYTRSLDFSGTSWAPEKLVSPIFEGYPEQGRYRDPSIIYVPEVATGGGGVFGDGEMPDAQEHRIRIAYEIYATDESEHGIYVCELDLNGNITYGPEQLGSLWLGQGESARPVLGIAREGSEKYTTAFYTLVTWYDCDLDELRCIMWMPDNSTSGITNLGSGITAFSLSPYANTPDTWHLAYIEYNNVMYRPVIAYPGWPQAGIPQTVLEGDESVYLNAPCIALVNAGLDGDTIGVTWQAYYWEFVTGVIQYSQRNTQTWSYPATWVPYYTTASYVKPSVTGSIGTLKATIAWQTTETPLMYTVRGRPSAWGSVASRGAGVDPTLSAGYLANSFEYLVSRGTTAPYAIQRQGITMTDENEEGDSMPLTSEGRGGRLMFRNGSLHIAVLDAQANEMRLGFAEMNDTARITLSQFENVLSTEPFAGTGMMKLTTLFTAKGQLPNGINIRMTLRDAATGNVVQNLRTFHVGDDTLVTFQTALNHGNRQLKLVLQPVGVSQLGRIDLERWYVVDEAASLAKQLAHATAPNGLPEVFAVHPNYPNPFNPSTTIKYDLPEAAQVSLVVYDLLGRKVTELVSGPKSEGYHSAMWDASAVASGVYFARFTATDMSGGVRLNKVSKLVLTK
ncbi:MAG: T9SS type A sorting domain-containing protein [Bacteroidetes bacterium]|nr:T9SS type A sorting domain-containing protein [Bacteroidota bacterium]MCW5894889.1 T9SS type A sorting domain-containing protein [Bacteroidota bacterium]